MKSMTGYGKSQKETSEYGITIEMKSVNHRFLDIQMRMPKEWNHLELAMKKIAKDTLTRGRVECFITMTKEKSSTKRVQLDWEIMDQLVRALSEAETTRYAPEVFSAKEFLSGGIMHPELVRIEETTLDMDQLESDVYQVFNEALLALDESRLIEGEEIKRYLLGYEEVISKEVARIKTYADSYESEHFERLETKLKSVIGEGIDDTRLLTEVALLIEKGDINEELDRLAIHLTRFNQLVLSEGARGKEIDFLIQEMNREVNTIGSKSMVIEIKESVVTLKTMIEKIREQVQNVE